MVVSPCEEYHVYIHKRGICDLCGGREHVMECYRCERNECYECVYDD